MAFTSRVVYCEREEQTFSPSAFKRALTEVENEPFSNKCVAAVLLSRLSFQAAASACSSKSKNLHLSFALSISDVTVPLSLPRCIYGSS